MSNQKLSLAVHVHIFYLNMWNDIKAHLQNMHDYPYDLYVTLNENNQDIIDDIQAFHKNSKVFVIENRGYDVGAFIYFLHQINLNDYDLILKIHSKNAAKKYNEDRSLKLINRFYWVKILFNSLLGSSAIFRKNIKAFQKDKKLGMIGAKYCIVSDKLCSETVKSQVRNMLQSWGYIDKRPILFVAGTMFMVRSQLMQKFKENFVLDDFLPTDGRVSDGSWAHVLERMFGCIVVEKGFKIKGFDSYLYPMFVGWWLQIRKFLFQKKITKKNYLLIKICKIPVFHRKLDL